MALEPGRPLQVSRIAGHGRAVGLDRDPSSPPGDHANCVLGCGTTNANCLLGCATDLTADDTAPAAAYEACAITSCASDCVYTGPAVGLGGSGNPSGGSANPSGGGANPSGGSANPSGGSANPSGGSGNAGGPPVVALTSGTNWLYIDAAAAPGTSGPNGALGIEGVFYAYGDPCSMAQMTWDPSTRCISGTLCTLDTLGTNWGVAIGFDFNNVNDVKHAWNATTAGATGIAWQTTNDLDAAMQVWIQNMDPSFNGTCSAPTCSINGPGDGSSAAANAGQFLFRTMTKDDWGGTGTVYTFDPADVSSLQFKLPSTSLGMEGYNVCIDKLGVVR